MKTKSIRLTALILACTLFVLMFAGCGGRNDKNGKISLSMYLYDRSMLKELTPWLGQKFPDIEFTFVQSYNTMEYYKVLLARDEELPDIITCRRFSLNDAAALADHLMDLSTSEVAGTFYSSYLDVNRETSGAIRWLPMCAEATRICSIRTAFLCPPIIPSLSPPSTPSRRSASRASRPTGIMTTAVWRRCRAAPFPS